MFKVTCPTFRATVSMDIDASSKDEAVKEFIRRCKDGNFQIPMFPDNYITVQRVFVHVYKEVV